MNRKSPTIEPMENYPVFEAVPKFDELVKELRLKISATTPLKLQADVLHEYLDDQSKLGRDACNEKWAARRLEIFLNQMALERFVEVVRPLKETLGLKVVLTKALKDSIIQDFKANRAKDAFYELEVAASLKLARFDVALKDPDIIVQGNGLSRPLGIACKYPESRQRLQDNVTEGYEQLETHCPYGVVCLGLDFLVAKDQGLQGWINFRRGGRSALEIQFHRLVNEIRGFKAERDRDYVGRHKLDGLMMTVSIVGLNGKQPGPERFESIAAGCLDGNPMYADLEVIRRGINGI
jgi:hypothetical protein